MERLFVAVKILKKFIKKSEAENLDPLIRLEVETELEILEARARELRKKDPIFWEKISAVFVFRTVVSKVTRKFREISKLGFLLPKDLKAIESILKNNLDHVFKSKIIYGTELRRQESRIIQ